MTKLFCHGDDPEQVWTSIVLLFLLENMEKEKGEKNASQLSDGPPGQLCLSTWVMRIGHAQMELSQQSHKHL